MSDLVAMAVVTSGMGMAQVDPRSPVFRRPESGTWDGVLRRATPTRDTPKKPPSKSSRASDASSAHTNPHTFTSHSLTRNDDALSEPGETVDANPQSLPDSTRVVTEAVLQLIDELLEHDVSATTTTTTSSTTTTTTSSTTTTTTSCTTTPDTTTTHPLPTAPPCSPSSDLSECYGRVVLVGDVPYFLDGSQAAMTRWRQAYRAWWCSEGKCIEARERAEELRGLRELEAGEWDDSGSEYEDEEGDGDDGEDTESEYLADVESGYEDSLDWEEEEWEDEGLFGKPELDDDEFVSDPESDDEGGELFVDRPEPFEG